MSFMALKRLFYRSEHNTKRRGRGGRQGIPKNRAQRVDENNGFVCLFIMFTSRVIVIKMSKRTNFLNFQLIAAKSLSHVR